MTKTFILTLLVTLATSLLSPNLAQAQQRGLIYDREEAIEIAGIGVSDRLTAYSENDRLFVRYQVRGSIAGIGFERDQTWPVPLGDGACGQISATLPSGVVKYRYTFGFCSGGLNCGRDGAFGRGATSMTLSATRYVHVAPELTDEWAEVGRIIIVGGNFPTDIDHPNCIAANP